MQHKLATALTVLFVVLVLGNPTPARQGIKATRITPPPSMAAPTSCFEEIMDQATSSCVIASSFPTPGALYPLGPELMIHPTGTVGVNQVDPNQIGQLEVISTDPLRPAIVAQACDEYVDGVVPEPAGVFHGGGCDSVWSCSTTYGGIGVVILGGHAEDFPGDGLVVSGGSAGSIDSGTAGVGIRANGGGAGGGVGGAGIVVTGGPSGGHQGGHGIIASGGGGQAAGDGLSATGGSGYGISGRGVVGTGGSHGAYAVEGVSGVGGDSTGEAGHGVTGYGGDGDVNSGHGVLGRGGSSATHAGDGVMGTAGISSAGNGYGVFSNGDFGGTGAKYFVQPHPTDPATEIRFVCLEGNESGTYFRGTGRVLSGRATIEVPEEFRLVTEEQGLTVQLTPVGALAVLAVEHQDLEEIRVLGSADVEFHYFVNGVRRGFAETYTPYHTNRAFAPGLRGEEFGRYLPDEIREMMVDNGILNPDFTPNEDTAARLGWKLRERRE